MPTRATREAAGTIQDIRLLAIGHMPVCGRDRQQPPSRPNPKRHHVSPTQKEAWEPRSWVKALLKEKEHSTMDRRQVAAYAALHAWRDAAARAADESSGFLLPRAALLALAMAVPMTASEVLRAMDGPAFRGRSRGALLRREAGTVAAMVAAAVRSETPPEGADPESGLLPRQGARGGAKAKESEGGREIDRAAGGGGAGGAQGAGKAGGEGGTPAGGLDVVFGGEGDPTVSRVASAPVRATVVRAPVSGLASALGGAFSRPAVSGAKAREGGDAKRTGDGGAKGGEEGRGAESVQGGAQVGAEEKGGEGGGEGASGGAVGVASGGQGASAMGAAFGCKPVVSRVAVSAMGSAFGGGGGQAAPAVAAIKESLAMPFRLVGAGGAADGEGEEGSGGEEEGDESVGDDSGEEAPGEEEVREAMAMYREDMHAEVRAFAAEMRQEALVSTALGVCSSTFPVVANCATSRPATI